MYILPTDSPTVGKEAMRMILAIVSSKRWLVKTTDIKSAFLQGKQLHREVYIRPSKEISTPGNIIWKLKHGIYGLKDGQDRFFLA